MDVLVEEGAQALQQVARLARVLGGRRLLRME